jgi:iron(III) transport system ATP-binding protein
MSEPGSGGRGDRRPVAVSVEGVDLSYGANRVLKNVSLEIPPGDLFAFLGPSGCGKTTLLRLIAGFNHADRGRVLIDGVDITGLPPWKRDVGMVFQSYALWPHMTVARNVAFGLEERRVPRAEIDKRVAAALELVGLSGLERRRPSELSGGQQQRVALARTIVIEPKVLLLDEPLSNLDARLRVEVRRELRELQTRLGITTIFVTHDQEEANTICDRIAVMSQGEVMQVGTPMELYEHPANLFVAGFLGTASIIEGQLSSDGKAWQVPGGGRIELSETKAIGPSARLVLRPQSVEIAPADVPATPGRGTFLGRIAHREFLGSIIRYGLALGEREILVDVPFRAGDKLLDIGAPMRGSIAPSAMVWLDR